LPRLARPEGVRRDRAILRGRGEALWPLARSAVPYPCRRAIPRRVADARNTDLRARDAVVEPRDALARVQDRLAERGAQSGHHRVRGLSRLRAVSRSRSLDGAAQGLDRGDQPFRFAERAWLESDGARARAAAYARRDGQIRPGVEPAPIPGWIRRAEREAVAAAVESGAHGGKDSARR